MYEFIKNLVSSRTMWGMAILLANSYFGGNIDPTVGNEAPEAFTNVFNAIGALLVVIGRLRAKPIIPPKVA